MGKVVYYKVVEGILSDANHKNFKDCERLIKESKTISDKDKTDFYVQLYETLLEEYGEMIYSFMDDN